MNLRTTLTATALSLFAFGAVAQTPTAAETPKLDARQAKQEARIDKGVATGKLTPAETKALDAQQGRIDRVENRAKADGTVTTAEKKHVTHMQNKANHNIKHQKHDAQNAAATPATK